MEGGWRQTGKGTEGGSGGEECSYVRRRHTLSKNEDEASMRSRQSVDSLQTMGDAESTGSQAQRRRTACTWARSERMLDGKREGIHTGVVTQSMEGDGLDSLWRAMNVIEGGQGTSEEA